ncbi:hypothetical protein LY90DRAFT_676835 [Neocallimastix californiae]|uniref:Uncharacterized protein n=1 Tax=Neocallimastix californiae TaxID=1754190 RepID=A0A1Y2ADD0_9FUNG|nr:hypothetical protein LY90DRAFT_676835 [Neocallimastix californiae]|eukprot:ORY20277.1 hypothetical protein LY90DRAFT_676835 [Neocallimastix californiae]
MNSTFIIDYENINCNSTNIKNISDLLGEEINKAQYFSPLFSWFVVTYTYYTIGRKNGTIWRYLFYVTTFGLIANVLDIIKRIIITYYKNQEEWEDYTKYCLLKNSRFSSQLHALIYIPIGLLELGLIICVLNQYLKEKKILSSTKTELYVLFHSTIGRTIMISLIYIYIAIDVLLKSNAVVELLRKIFWRVKGIFGVIFLVDLLLLKIDIDQNKILIQKDLINIKNKFEIIRSVPTHRKNSLKSLSNYSNFSQYQNLLPSTALIHSNESLNHNSTNSNIPLVNQNYP